MCSNPHVFSVFERKKTRESTFSLRALLVPTKGSISILMKHKSSFSTAVRNNFHLFHTTLELFERRTLQRSLLKGVGVPNNAVSREEGVNESDQIVSNSLWRERIATIHAANDFYNR